MFMEYKVRSGKHFKTRSSWEQKVQFGSYCAYRIFPNAKDLRVSVICAPESIFSRANSVWPLHFRISFHGSSQDVLPFLFPKITWVHVKQKKTKPQTGPIAFCDYSGLQENSCDYKVWEAEHTLRVCRELENVKGRPCGPAGGAT